MSARKAKPAPTASILAPYLAGFGPGKLTPYQSGLPGLICPTGFPGGKILIPSDAIGRDPEILLRFAHGSRLLQTLYTSDLKLTPGPMRFSLADLQLIRDERMQEAEVYMRLLLAGWEGTTCATEGCSRDLGHRSVPSLVNLRCEQCARELERELAGFESPTSVAVRTYRPWPLPGDETRTINIPRLILGVSLAA